MPKKSITNPEVFSPNSPADIERVLTRTPGPDLKPGLEKAIRMISEEHQKQTIRFREHASRHDKYSLETIDFEAWKMKWLSEMKQKLEAALREA